MDWNLNVLTVGPLQMNAVLLVADGAAGREGVLIDPGAEAPRLLRAVDDAGCRLVGLLATHGHFDHVGAAADIQRRLTLPLRCHPDDVPLVRSLPRIQEAYGFPPDDVPEVRGDLLDGSEIPLADGVLRVRHVPGHSPGQVMFLWEDHAIVGDCLFAGSVGRTDLPGGDFAALEKSIRERIYTLPDETVIICGHGPDTTVGRERSGNPFVRG